MKTFKSFNFNERTAMVQADGCTAARQKIGVNPRITSTFARFVSSLCLILTMLFTFGVEQMWAGSVNGGDIYFDASTSGWGDVDVNYIISHDNYSCWYEMTHIDNTKLHYISSGSWGDSKYFAFTSDYGWGNNNCEGNSYDSRKTYGPDGKKYTAKSTYGVNSGSVYLFYASSSENDAAITTSSPAGYKSGGVTDLNSTQTVKFAIAENGGTPAELSSGTTPAKIRMRSYKFTSGTNGSVSAESPSDWTAGSSTYNQTFTAARTATTTVTVSNEVDGYTFLGWYSAANGGTELSTNKEYTYYPTAATTVYARFSHETTHTVNITYVCASPSATVSTATSQAIGQVTASSITAPTVTGYTFVNWTLGNGVADQGSNLAANPISVKTLGSGTYTMQANYTEDLSSPYIVSGGNKIVTTGTTWRTTADANNKMNKKTEHSTESNAYFTVNVTAVNQGSANTNYQFKLYNTSTSTHYGLTGTTQYYLNRSESGTAKTTSSPGINVELRADALGEYELKVNYSSTPTLTVTYPTAYAVTFGKGTGGNTVTAKYSSVSFTSGTKVQSGKTVTFTQTASTGYQFKEWNTNSSGTGTRLSTSTTYNRTVASSNNVYAIFSPRQYTITLNDQDATTAVDPSTVKATYKSLTLSSSITNPEKDGYTFGGWYSAVGGGGYQVINTSGALQANKSGYTDATGWTKTDAATLYAKWTQVLVLDKNGGATDGGLTVVYKKTTTSGHTAATRTGYTLAGYYDAPSGGNKIINANGSLVSYSASVSSYIRSDGSWGYNGTPTLYAQWTVHKYTIAFNANDANYIGTATGSTASMENVEYDAAVNLTSNGFSRAHYTFAGWATTPTGAVTYSNGQEVSNLSSTNGATVTLYAKWTGDTYTVSFNQGAGTCPTSSTTVQYGSTYGSGSGLGGNMPTATAPGGYVFSGWFDAPAGGRLIEKDSVVTATTDHTLYARYTKQDRVYFYNNLGWTDVYVTYDAYWDNDNGTGNYEKIYHHMTRMGSSNIWYDDIPTSVLSSWKYFIAFNSKQLGAVGESSNWGNFDSGEAIYRYDFDSYATMFVPKTGDTWKKNNDKCTYQSSSSTYDAAEGIHGKNYRHSTGYWVRYNETKCGYAITGTWDSWANTTDFQAENAGDDTYIVTKTLAANTTYDFLLYKDYSTNSYNHIFTYTAATITSGSCTNKSLTTNGTKYSELETHHTKITTTAAGEYVFKLTPGTDGVLKLSVEYPFAVNDYRVTYNWNDGSAHSHSSEIIKAAAGTNETISVFVHKAANVKSQSLKIEKCTAINGSGVATWTAGNTIALPSEEITANGVYNFIITQPASGNPTGAFWNKYDGNYYIRTESSDGGWNYYKDYEDNIMTYSDYSLTQTLSDPYSHYYCRYIENCGMDITYQIATDYSSCVSDVFVGDATIGGAGNKTLPSGNPASIRFSWNEQTNAMRRAYLKSAQGAGNSRYLVLHGSDNKVRNNDATGTEISASGDLLANELQFTDNGNWVYQVSLKAMPGAKVCLIAKYNGSDRYLVGDGDDDWLTILGGTGSSKYEIAAVYDFKTNRLMTAWTPSGAISDKLKDVDLMLIRHAQEAATSVTFSGSGSLEAKKVIGALRMDYNELFGHVAGWTSSSRPLLKFFISFPFDVYVSDVFGLNSAYGDAYVIQRYAGDERAEKGFFRGDGTTSFWTDLTISDTLHANVGYCVILDNDYFNGDLGSIWQNKSAGSSVHLYFPSAGDVGNIESNEKTITIPPHECTINRTFGSGKNHKNTDSHWNLMGVPIFNDHTGSSAAGTPGAIFVTTGDQDKDCHYFYEWNSGTNQFSIRAALGYVFKSMHSYMVQYTGDVTFTGSAIIPASIAARRAPMNKNYNIELQVLNSDAEMLNRTYVELREEACDTFALNEDVYMSTNTNAVNIYTFAGNYDVAANVLSVNNHSIPVGLNVRTAGTYTITMPSAFSGTTILYDKQTGIRTNLAISNYEVELPKDVIDDRFVLEIDDISEIVTDIEFTTGEGSIKDGKAHKFIQNGLLYILQNGVIYDAQGKRVQ